MKALTHFTIIGFGNQAKAWALNLKDSGVKVLIGLRENSSSIELCHKLGFESFNFEKTEIPTIHFALLTPDETHHEILEKLYKINTGKSCLYAHGFSLNKEKFQSTYPSFEHILLAPKSIASELRFLYETKGKIGAIYSLEHANSTDLSSLEEIAKKVGITSVFPATFQEETEADLFSEQSILCSILPYAANKTFNTLRESGYPKELAFYECFYEVKLIADTLIKVGPKKFFELISPNALIGSQIGLNSLLDQDFENKLGKILLDIKNGNFGQVIYNTDIKKLRKNITEHWDKQELSQVYNELKDLI